ncbi:MAG: hypothetical protein R3C16_06550 [Hyphomonadaceae bacterium]
MARPASPAGSWLKHLLKTYGAEGEVRWAMGNDAEGQAVVRSRSAPALPLVEARATDANSLPMRWPIAPRHPITVGPYQRFAGEASAAPARAPAPTMSISAASRTGWRR